MNTFLKKTVALILSAATVALPVMAGAPVTRLPLAATEEAAATDNTASDRVEISFRVGDDTLLINGEQKTVEKPYVVGEGVTLVPVRVITEAFGVEVGWEDATQTVTLDYPDVSIVLQIGNGIAEVNGKAETLLAAPELSEAGFTMVPLRFISENFGAEVSYDEETESILVIKESLGEGEMVEGQTKTYVGDSYYGWTMLNPKNMDMVSRSFDGTYTLFNDPDSNRISVTIRTPDEDYDFDKIFKEDKKYYSDNFTLTKAVSDSSSEIKTMHFQYRSEGMLYEQRFYLTDKYEYNVTVITTPNGTHKDEMIAYADSFHLVFETEDTHDLSNLENGMRKFESEELNFTLYLPADYSRYTSRAKMNSFTFVSNTDERSRVALSIYSESEVSDPLRKTFDDSRLYFLRPQNEELVKAEATVSREYPDFTAYEFDYTVNGSKKNDRVARNLMFVKDGYFYILYISFAKGDNTEHPDDLFDPILNNAEFRTIDAEKVGVLIPEEVEDNGETKEEVFASYAFDIPEHYEKLSGDDNKTLGIYYSELDHINVSYLSMTPGSNNISASSMAENVEKQMLAQQTNARSIQKVTRFNTKEAIFYTFTISYEQNDDLIYDISYVCDKGGVFHVFTTTFSELYYSEHNRKTVEEVVRSFRSAD